VNHCDLNRIKCRKLSGSIRPMWRQWWIQGKIFVDVNYIDDGAFFEYDLLLCGVGRVCFIIHNKSNRATIIGAWEDKNDWQRLFGWWFLKGLFEGKGRVVRKCNERWKINLMILALIELLISAQNVIIFLYLTHMKLSTFI